ncbi:arylformamidase [Methanocalculus alkaliphilus]|uniref:cyclase family protein n=1 Tax=Methanocalculus alkaliphilus TaxID=768730 RepID=UPI0020A16C67|nr:cyclase family protein [Methanocalculus alkaliphilus]MCP1715651.1 arylformamidase [Methanocalculus alkaliphilus]
MTIHDITRQLSPETFIWPGDPAVSYSQRVQDGFTITEIRMGSHSGTHIDAPLHAIPGGAGIEKVPLEACVGPVLLKDIPPGPVPAGVVDTISLPRVIIRSGWSADEPDRYGYLQAEDARALVEGGIVAIGTDAPSIEAPDGDGSVHRILLAAGVVIIELLDPGDLPGGEYMMVALPISCRGLDGSPARVILIEDMLP